MRRSTSLLLVLALMVGMAGCSDKSASQPKPRADAAVDRPPPPPPPPKPSAEASSSEAKPQPPVAPVQSPTPTVTPPAPALTPAAPPTASTQFAVSLATGVSLAQTGPEGTMMLFSVDYEVTLGAPATAGYLWVIERAHGNAAKVEEKLASKGTLQTGMVTGWKPEDGPFRCHLEDHQGHRVSESIEMPQTDGG
jgi:hypothetical protein